MVTVWTGFSLSGVLVVTTLSLVGITQLTGCSAPKRAPVVSRESGRKYTSSVSRARPGSYNVRRGDTLFSISWRFGLDHLQLARWNGIRSPYTIYPGQRLRLSAPPKRYTPPPRTVASKPKAPAVSKAKKPSPKPVTRAGTARPGSGKSATTKSSAKSLKLSWRWPTKGRVLEGYRRGDPSRKGVKIKGRNGQSIVAAEAGKIVYAGSGLIGYGRLIIIKHNKNYLSAYGYNKKVLVKEGDQVKRGEQIALMGNNGTGKTMLHFEIRRNGAPVDPLTLLPRNR
ncbi:hypothetical protein BOW51_07990 [Solemya velesiana gill symbiont]|uniref:LysM domain-containing protein n=1 Tax=Solemya velesiana gill symbiont TaxID=1918948 RepID=A0A1T2KU80_9GAMM|nr:hypothetical protein BOW51_07990 [Solemya velesiana gill symbiont]